MQPPAGLLLAVPAAEFIWDELTIDFITGLPPSVGHISIMVVVDRFSKAAHLVVLPPITTSKHATIFFSNIVRLHRISKSIITDRNPLFVSQFWAELFRLHGIKLAMSSAYHPQMDGQTEVLNHCLEDYLHCLS